jgi:hypothetical protein
MLGLALLVSAVVLVFVRATRLLRHAQEPGLVWVLGFMVFYAMFNMAETGAWTGNDQMTEILVYMVVRVNFVALAARTRSMAKSADLAAPRGPYAAG